VCGSKWRSQIVVFFDDEKFSGARKFYHAIADNTNKTLAFAKDVI
jgi:hypothetical protein